MIAAVKREFTRAALVEELSAAGFTIVGSDYSLSPLDALLGIPPVFWASVEADHGDLLRFATSVIEKVWSVFERGQMEFSGFLTEDGRAAVTVKQCDAEGEATRG